MSNQVADLVIAVITHDSLPVVAGFLAGHARAAERLGAGLVVVDNASKDGTAAFLRDFSASHDHVTVRHNSRNVGYATAVNQAFRAVPGADVLLLNPDVECEDPEKVTQLQSRLADDPGVGVVGPLLYNAEGTVQESARELPDVLAMGGHASLLRYLPFARRRSAQYLAIPEGRQDRGVPWLVGAAMLIRREAYESVGGFDERFFLYMEDCDFCLRCGLRGWKTVYAPSVRLLHLFMHASYGSGSVLTSRARRAHVISAGRFFLKHPALALRR